MINLVMAVLLGLFQTSACDSNNDVVDPDVTGKWIGVVEVPNSPLSIYSLFRFEISDTAISGTGTYELYEGTELFRTTEITVTGTYDFPSIFLNLTSADERSDTFVGNLNEAATEMSGFFEMPKLSISERRRDGDTTRPFWALGGEATMKFTRPTE